MEFVPTNAFRDFNGLSYFQWKVCILVMTLHLAYKIFTATDNRCILLHFKQNTTRWKSCENTVWNTKMFVSSLFLQPADVHFILVYCLKFWMLLFSIIIPVATVFQRNASFENEERKQKPALNNNTNSALHKMCTNMKVKTMF